MTEDVSAVADLSRDFFATVVTPQAEKYAAQGHPDKEAYQRAGELGLLCMSIPEEFGGGGGTFAHEAAMLTEQALAGDTALHLGVDSIIVPHYILAYGTDEQKKHWLPRIGSGNVVAAIAMTEPGAGSDLQSMRTRAVKCEDGYRISGEKTFISNGHNADVVIVAAKTDPESRGAGISLLIVDLINASTGDLVAGFSRGAPMAKVGQKGQDTTTLSFDDVLVPHTALLGVENSGFRQLKTQLASERLILGVVAVAAIEKAVDLATTYSKEREMFGQRLFDFQNTRFELAECATVARIARVFVDDCIDKHLRGELDATTAAMAKYWLSDQQCGVIDRCLQLFGGYGYTLEYPIGQMYADARIQRIYAGSNEVMKELISRKL
ncbi:acyl-CoA dehydrogenase family protein [Aldersonia kunmingensis]|uniref:acyl-CoA dehydrogenase family protein n=1 Tax=Aldersonia kunmingensis TaxID=408066 RepID=UPI00082A5339|nr:acyl-CoA dehydrogenase family protein [Aldersonia kunmingensis]